MKNNHKKLVSAILVFFFLASFMLVLIEPAVARPGGGHSYSGGGGGGGGGGDLIGLLIYLIFSLLPPYISIPLVIIIVIAYKIYMKKEQSANKQVTSTPTYANITQTVANIEHQLHILKTQDPNFSRVMFIDFITSLFVKLQAYKYDVKKLITINPFIDKSIIEQFKLKQANTQISEIVVGSVDIVNIQFGKENTKLTVEIKANYTVTNAGKSLRYIVAERWLVQRKNGVISPEPEKMHKLSCPACGAPANFTDAGICEHCGTLIVPGANQWFVKNRAVVMSETIKTNALLTYAVEVGTNFPTIYSPAIESQKQYFAKVHNTTWEQYWSILYHKIASPYFMNIYENWSNLTWDKVRHLMTDRLWESYKFWIDEYKRHGFRNKLDDTKILKIHVAKIEIDKFYEAVTLRIFASTKDYVVDKSGKLVAGNNKNARVFSEYWTFIRRTGVENDNYDMKTCPNCGAPLDKMGQNGVCAYCNTKVTTGNFSWVVAIVTQDEEYRG